MALVPPVLVPQLTAVLNDAIDQLAVLGGTSQSRQTERDLMMETIVGDEIARIVGEQRDLEQRYDDLLEQRTALQEQSDMTGLAQNDAALRDVAQKLKASTVLLCKNLRSKPGSLDNSIKVQSDRKYLQGVLEDLVVGVSGYNTFESLEDEVTLAHEEAAEVEATIERERAARAQIRRLKAEIERVRKEKATDAYEKTELIAQLKDQRQEVRVRTQMEKSYMVKSAQVQVQTAAKRKQIHSKELEKHIAELKDQIAEETLVHEELKAFFKRTHEKLAEKLEEWNERYDRDNEAKKAALDQLKEDRARDLAKLQELTDRYTEYTKVIQQDKKKKKKAEEEAKRAMRQLAAVIRLQAWWRGMLVRNKMGPFALKKGKSGKGKKGKKGKKK
eukprot:m.361198 g.361198  ORF g.361198 m.361198 type:complete len:388 (+) comp19408_c0_seq1:269-1432(+)